MPSYRVNIPDKGSYRVDSLTPLTEDEVIARVLNSFEPEPEPEPEPELPDPTFGGALKETVKGVGRGFVGSLETAGKGLAALLPESAETPVVSGLEAVSEALSPELAPEYRDAEGLYGFLPKVGEGIGSFTSFLVPGGAAVGAARLAGAGARATGQLATGAATTFGGALGAGEARERAQEAGATEGEVAAATGLGILPGLIDAVVPSFRVLKRITGKTDSEIAGELRTKLSQRLLDPAGVGVFEAATEVTQGIIQNAIAQKVYDPDQPLIVGDQIIDEAGVGFTVGALAEAITTSALGGRKTRFDQKTVADEEARQAQLAQEKAADEAAKKEIETDLLGGLLRDPFVPDEETKIKRETEVAEQEAEFTRVYQSLSEDITNTQIKINEEATKTDTDVSKISALTNQLERLEANRNKVVEEAKNIAPDLKLTPRKIIKTRDRSVVEQEEIRIKNAMINASSKGEFTKLSNLSKQLEEVQQETDQGDLFEIENKKRVAEVNKIYNQDIGTSLKAIAASARQRPQEGIDKRKAREQEQLNALLTDENIEKYARYIDKLEMTGVFPKANFETRKKLEAQLYEGILTPVSGKALGIKVDKESPAYEYIPEINERLKELNKKRIGDVLNAVSPKVTLFNEKGQLTRKGLQLAQDEMKFNVLNRVKTAAISDLNKEPTGKYSEFVGVAYQKNFENALAADAQALIDNYRADDDNYRADETSAAAKRFEAIAGQAVESAAIRQEDLNLIQKRDELEDRLANEDNLIQKRDALEDRLANEDLTVAQKNNINNQIRQITKQFLTVVQKNNINNQIRQITKQLKGRDVPFKDTKKVDATTPAFTNFKDAAFKLDRGNFLGVTDTLTLKERERNAKAKQDIERLTDDSKYYAEQIKLAAANREQQRELERKKINVDAEIKKLKAGISERDTSKAKSLKARIVKDANEATLTYVENAVKEVNAYRNSKKQQPLTELEENQLRIKLKSSFDSLLNRITDVPTGELPTDKKVYSLLKEIENLRQDNLKTIKDSKGIKPEPELEVELPPKDVAPVIERKEEDILQDNLNNLKTELKDVTEDIKKITTRANSVISKVNTKIAKLTDEKTAVEKNLKTAKTQSDKTRLTKRLNNLDKKIETTQKEFLIPTNIETVKTNLNNLEERLKILEEAKKDSATDPKKLPNIRKSIKEFKTNIKSEQTKLKNLENKLKEIEDIPPEDTSTLIQPEKEKQEKLIDEIKTLEEKLKPFNDRLEKGLKKLKKINEAQNNLTALNRENVVELSESFNSLKNDRAAPRNPDEKIAKKNDAILNRREKILINQLKKLQAKGVLKTSKKISGVRLLEELEPGKLATTVFDFTNIAAIKKNAELAKKELNDLKTDIKTIKTAITQAKQNPKAEYKETLSILLKELPAKIKAAEQTQKTLEFRNKQTETIRDVVQKQLDKTKSELAKLPKVDIDAKAKQQTGLDLPGIRVETEVIDPTNLNKQSLKEIRKKEKIYDIPRYENIIADKQAELEEGIKEGKIAGTIIKMSEKDKKSLKASISSFKGKLLHARARQQNYIQAIEDIQKDIKNKKLSRGFDIQQSTLDIRKEKIKELEESLNDLNLSSRQKKDIKKDIETEQQIVEYFEQTIKEEGDSAATRKRTIKTLSKNKDILFSEAKEHANNIRILFDNVSPENRKTVAKELNTEVEELKAIVADAKAEVIKLEKDKTTKPRKLSDAQAKLKNAQENYTNAVIAQTSVSFDPSEYDKFLDKELQEKDKLKASLKSLGVDPIETFDDTETTNLINSISGQDILYRIGAVNFGIVKFTEAAPLLKDMQAKTKKMGITLNVYEDTTQLPNEILDNLAFQNMSAHANRVKGGVMPDGTVFVITSHHESIEDLEITLAHELVGHYTFEGMLGKDGMDKLLKRVEKSYPATKDNPAVFELARELGVEKEAQQAFLESLSSTQRGLEEGTLSSKEVVRLAQLKALREVIAYTAQKLDKPVTKTFASKVKKFLQDMVYMFRNTLVKNFGFISLPKISTDELFFLMRQAEKNFKQGKAYTYRNEDGTISLSTAATVPEFTTPNINVMEVIDKIIEKPTSQYEKLTANWEGLNFRTQFIDRADILERIKITGQTLKDKFGNPLLDAIAATDLTYFIRKYDQRQSLVAEAATTGVAQVIKDPKTGEVSIGRDIKKETSSIKKVAEALGRAKFKDANATKAFTGYMLIERAESIPDGVRKLGLDKISKAQRDAVQQAGRNNKAFQEARKYYNEYNNDLINLLADTGYIDANKARELKRRKDYIPAYRPRKDGIVDLVIDGEEVLKIGNLSKQPELKELVGLPEDLKNQQPLARDITETALQNTQIIMDLALRNIATRNVALTLEGLGIAKKVSSSEAVKKKPTTITAKENGKETTWEITPENVEAFKDMPADLLVKGLDGIQTTLPGIMNVFSIPTNIFRSFITRSPDYALRQIFRDSVIASFTSGGNTVPILGAFKTLGKMAKGESDAAKELRAAGVGGGQVFSGSPRDVKKIFSGIASGKPGWHMIAANLDALAVSGDIATRANNYDSFIKQGLSKREAELASLELMNFTRRGVSPSVMFLNAMIPFLSANIQGLDVTYRAMKGTMTYQDRLKIKTKLLKRGALLAALTAAYAIAWDDDETYENAQPYQRFGNWFVPVPGMEKPFKVPIPFELGIIFKAIPEGLVRLMASDDKASSILKDIGKMAVRSVPGDIPLTLKPIIEAQSNYSFFLDAPVVGGRFSGTDPIAQYKSSTPELLKTLGYAGISPLKAEYIVRGYTGSLGLALLSIPDALGFKAMPTGESVEQPSFDITDVPLVKSFFQPTDSGYLISQAYETVADATSAKKTYNNFIKNNQPEQAKKYLQKNLSRIQLSTASGRYVRTMGKINNREAFVRGSKDLTADEKRKEIKRLKQLRIDISKKFKELKQRIERPAVAA